ncbi:TPA: hypothetical protein MFD22_000556 [Klebsiella pneumoniae]|uniref:hypothetical protein n=1 Tax=Klebsiella sp. GB_Kp058 TaxID=3153406 RepID=UPI0032B5F0C5|nr:hypothetical protein [Klebsiella pneumoniae]
MKLSSNEIKECQKLISELETSGWEIIGAYWVHYAQGYVAPEKQGKLSITAIGISERRINFYRLSLDSAIKRLNLKLISAHDIRLANDDEFHSGIFHLEEKKELTLLKNVFFKNTYLSELYIIKCIESETTRKHSPRQKITIFKYFESKEFKDDFLNGRFWLGTLRGYSVIENENQGDKLEGVTLYRTSESFDGDGWLEFSKKNPTMGGMIKFNGPFDGTIYIEDPKVRLPNAYTLCFSKVRNDDLFRNDFGEFCVKINDVEKLFAIITLSLFQVDPSIAKKSMGHISVDYSKETLTALDSEHFSAFHKPRTHKWQTEYRFVWNTDLSYKIKPFLLDASRLLSSEIIEDII